METLKKPINTNDFKMVREMGIIELL